MFSSDAPASFASDQSAGPARQPTAASMGPRQPPISSTSAHQQPTTLGLEQAASGLPAGRLARWIDFPKLDNLTDAFSLCCSTAVIFGGLVPYIPQYLKIKQASSNEGFSTYVCLTLLIANILRIMFWFGHSFELPLLIQSFVMIAGMILMMDLCIRVRDRDSSFTISAISGLQGPANQRRRFLNALSHSGSSMDISSSVHLVTTQQADTLQSLTFPSYQNSNQLELPPPPPPPPLPATETFASKERGADGEGEEEEEEEEESNAEVIAQAKSGSESIREDFEPRITNEASSDNPSTAAPLNQSQTNYSGTTIKCSSATNTFWDWDNYFSYVKFLSLFTFIVSLLTYLLLDYYIYVETLGFVAVFTESMLGVPQLLGNHRKKSTQGMSVEMVVMWLSGDLFKTLYSVLRHAPVQFYVCGSIQIIVDILILCQVFWYKRPVVLYRKLPKST